MGKKKSKESKKCQLKRQRLKRRQKVIRINKWVEQQCVVTASGRAVSPISPVQALYSPPVPAPTNEGVAESRNVSPNVKENDANCGEEVKKLIRKLQEMRKEHKAEVERIRYIWKDKIYGEKTRAGKMLKFNT